MVIKQLIPELIKENWSTELEYVMQDPILFGDFMPALPLDQDQEKPRIYEDIG